MRHVRRVRFDQLDSSMQAGHGELTRSELVPADGFITMPGHEYIPRSVDPRVLDAFRTLSEAMRAQFAERPEYPNARLYPWYTVDNASHPNTVDFMLAWGTATRLPIPRTYMAKEYFGLGQRIIAARRHQALIQDTMDGQGLVGRVHMFDDQPYVSIVSRAATPGSYLVSGQELPELPGSDQIEIAAEASQLRPLRFHANVQLNPHSGYMCQNFYPDDESRILGQIDLGPFVS